MPDIDRESYPTALTALTSAARAVLQLADVIDLARMREICGQMEALAPVLEPTASLRGGMTNLQDQAAFLAALDTFVTDVRKLDRRPAMTSGREG